ncbi:hypothetical protein PAECIP111893_02408 [Paenibacillus plantiphilus]|uniref:Uncharacterized protein n=1 Tax=Paenibacillus plantiphilus TaxID=2905650 RepID=A0ABN8GCP3_9BACL|nr:hypothetical protein [Paenibacillus plantiphilus]CAH1205747.1 hypothetical protein PAECIP111893_02408 [Paenibacillus plantiphilus]
MNELDFYKFANENELDWRGDKLIMWIYPSDIPELVELIGYNALSEDGLPCVICGLGQVAIEANVICEWFDIDPERIHPKDGD